MILTETSTRGDGSWTLRGRFPLWILLINCRLTQYGLNRRSTLVAYGQIISILPNTPMPSASPTWLNSIKVPPASPAPVALEPIATPADDPSRTPPPTNSPSHMPTVIASQDTEAPSPAPISNIIETAPPSALPTLLLLTKIPSKVTSRSKSDVTLLVAVLIPVASISALLLLILLGRRRRHEPYLSKDNRWNAIMTQDNPPELGHTSYNQSAFDDSSLYTKSSNPGGGDSNSVGFQGGSTNSAAGWIAARNEQPIITEEPTEETDTEDEGSPDEGVMVSMEEGSSVRCYSNDTDISGSFLSEVTNQLQKISPDNEARTAVTGRHYASGTSSVVSIVKNSKEAIVEETLKNDDDVDDGNVEVSLPNYRRNMHDGIQNDDIIGVESSCNRSGDLSKVPNRESLYTSSDHIRTGFTTLSDQIPRPVLVPMAAANSRSGGGNPLSFLKRKQKKVEAAPAASSNPITSENTKCLYNVSDHRFVNPIIDDESRDTGDIPMSSILHEFNYHDGTTDNSSTIEPFSELTGEYVDHRSVGSDGAIVEESDLQLAEFAHPAESSSCDSSAVNLFETDNESNASSRSASSPLKLFQSSKDDFGAESNVVDFSSSGEDRNINSFEQLYESISSEWEWKEPSALSLNDVTPSLYPDVLKTEKKRPDSIDSADAILDSSYGGRDHI